MFEKTFIPQKPFPDFKWRWASFQCTEGLNDPVVLLGVLNRMYKLEELKVKYSSEEFTNAMRELANSLVGRGINVSLADRTGNRNLMRNSKQYWKAVRLIPKDDGQGSEKGIIRLTDFGRKVASHEISQAEFAALTIQTYTLPNTWIQTAEECRKWIDKGIYLTPLKMILQIIFELSKSGSGAGHLTADELIKIVVPLSGCKASIHDYVNFIKWYRDGEINTAKWPDCCTDSNDRRFVKEYLLFLTNYGYLIKMDTDNKPFYILNEAIKDEIHEIINQNDHDKDLENALRIMRETRVVSEVERKRVQNSVRTARPNQASFRKQVLAACGHCVISNVTMPEILEAAHIIPYKYNGEDTIANGFAMRVDIHTLFDTGHLRISPEGNVELSSKAQLDYGHTLPYRIFLPDFTNRDFLRWRWENYNGL